MWTIATGHGLYTVRLLDDWTTYRPIGGEALKRLLGPMARLRKRIADRSERHRHIAELQQLDDWMLADIGLDRAEIPHVVDELMAHRSEELDSRLPTGRTGRTQQAEQTEQP